MIGKRREDRQDREATKGMPVAAARGLLAGTLGLPSDIINIGGILYSLATGKQVGEVPYGSEYFKETLPLKDTTPAGSAATEFGSLFGGAGLGRPIKSVSRLAGQAVNDAMVYNAGPLAAITPQPMRMFIGPQAKTYDVGRALKAEEMLKAGVPADQVWKETGTMVGKDGIPRQEISDVGSTFRNADDLKQLKENYKGMIEAGKEKLRPDRTGQKDLFPKQLTEAKKPFREQLAGLKENMREIDKNPRTQGVAAKYTLDHPELYRAYPELADISITQTPTLGSEKGSLTTIGGIIHDLNIKDVRDPRSVALHEMQHAIQNIEGMSPGANPTFAYQNPQAFDILKELREKATAPIPFEDYVKQGGYFADDPAEIARAKRDYKDYVSDIPSIAKKLENEFQRDAATQWYKRQHGEAEARNTQERADLSNQERREIHPYTSMDVPEEKLLTRDPILFTGILKSEEGMKRGGPVHVSDNPDVMQLELAGGGIVKKLAGAAKPAPMKASEALGQIEGRPLVITQADRTKVGGGYLGGPGFSGLQLEDPAYRAAEAAWAVKNPGTAKMILGGNKAAGKDPVFAAMLGTPTQHQSNQMVFDKLYGDFKKAAKKGDLDPELKERINLRLANTVDKNGNPIFPPDIDILDKNFKNIATTFDQRAVTANLIGGMGVGGKKGQIIDYDKIILNTTDPALVDAPTGALGNRLFTLSGGVIERPDLHPAFPTILQGEDLGVSFEPVTRELIMKDFIEKTMREKGRAPGYMDYTRGYPPSQLITEDILTEMQKMGKKAGGAIRKAAGGGITGDDLILEERPL
jgi:hypothetical protein